MARAFVGPFIREDYVSDDALEHVLRARLVATVHHLGGHATRNHVRTSHYVEKAFFIQRENVHLVCEHFDIVKDQ